MAPPSRRGRKRKPVSHYTDDNPSTFTTKEKHGTPSSAAKESPASSSSMADTDTDNSTNLTPPAASRPSRPRKRPLDDSKMISHSHDMRLHSILPSNLLPHSSAENDVGDVIFGKGLGVPPPLPPPEWQLVSTPHMAQAALLSSKSGEKKKVTPPRLTCMDVSTEENYMCFGNSLGEILIYGVVPLVIHIATLPTSASGRNTEEWQYSKKRNEVNAIHCISMASSRIVVATSQEVECYDAVSQKLVWRYEIPSNVSITKLDIQETTHDVLACVTSGSGDGAVVAESQSQSQSQPLWLLSYDDDDVHVKKDLLDASILRCAAMWDRSNPNRMVAVTTSIQDEQPQELLLMEASDGTILQKATLPLVRTSKSIESISQSSKGMYTSVASSKGVRLFLTSSLQLVHTYGEGLALHGHGLVYQQAAIFSKLPEKDYKDGAGVLILGIPHARREPRELQDQIQIWQWWDSVHPSHTLHGPPRSLGLVGVHASSQQDSLLALTHAGDVWMLSPTATTDWPGVMYPPGYNVINDNLVYIEDEDELDHAVDDDDGEEEDVAMLQQDEVLDDELAEALRQSMLEQRLAKQEEDVVVADNIADDTKPHGIVIPCHPDPSLREAIEQNPNGLNSPKRSSTGEDVLPACFLRQVLGVIPTRDSATRARPRVKALEAAPNLPTNKGTRGKRSRTGNLEAMIRASINPDLQKFMTSKELWADGKGSTLRDVDKVVSTNGGTTTASERGTVEEMGNAAIVTSAALTEQTQGNVAQSLRNESVLTIEESTNGGLHGEATSKTAADEATEKALSKVMASRPMDDDATSALEAMLALHRTPSEDASPQKSSAPRVPPVPHFESQSNVITTPRIDMVVTNSPAASLNPPTNAFAATTAMEVDSQGSALNGGLAIAAVSAVAPSSVDQIGASGMAVETEKAVVSLSEEGLPRFASGASDMEADVIGTNQGSPSSSFCSACRGRMVIHTCEKREVPVDVEAMERAEKERLAKEAEKKKRQRAEKRRKSDARRRELKKKKKLEEERQRRIEEEQRRAEEEQRRAEEEEMERSRQQAEARLSGDHYERDRRRAEMWQRLMAANGGDRQDDGYGAQADERDTTTSGHPLYPPPAEQRPPAAALNQVQQEPYEHMHGIQRSDEVQQQTSYRQSYEQTAPVASQSLYSSQQEQSRFGGHPIDTSSATAQAGYGRASPAAQAVSYPASNQQLNSAQVQPTYTSASSAAPFVDKQQETVGGQQYASSTYQIQQQTAAPAVQNPNASVSSVTENGAEGTQQRDSPYERSQSSDYRSSGDEQAPPRPGLLERRSSAQLGTAEALASLASMCVQMPRAPTPQDSPHGTGLNGAASSTSIDSQSQHSSLQAFAEESPNPSQPLVSGQSEFVARNDANASNANADSSTLTEQTLRESQPGAPDEHGDSPPRQDVAGFNANSNVDKNASATSQEMNGQSSSADATALAASQDGRAKVTPFGSETFSTAGTVSQGKGISSVEQVVAPASSATNDASAQGDSQVNSVAENATPPVSATAEGRSTASKKIAS